MRRGTRATADRIGRVLLSAVAVVGAGMALGGIEGAAIAGAAFGGYCLGWWNYGRNQAP